jgi:GntR family transcriptional regulator
MADPLNLVFEASVPPVGDAAPRPGSRRDAPVRRVADLLRTEFVRSRHPGGVLPSEDALVRQLGVSRNVLRAGLAELVREGLVARVRSKGTIPCGRTDTQALRELRGLSDLLPTEGTRRLHNIVISAELVPAPRPIADRLAVPFGADSVLIERLRLLDGVPFSIETSWLAGELAAGVLELSLARQDLFSAIEQGLGLPLGSATVSIEAMTADDVTARFLEMAPGIALLLVTRETRLADGRPLAFEFLRYRGDRMTLQAEMCRPATPSMSDV